MRRSFTRFHKAAAVLTLYGLMSPVFAFAIDEKPTSKKSLSDDQKIIHVLNRLGFGARPGDVEKVRTIGLQKYIDQQLNPASIDDAVAENKVKNLEIFNMSTAEVFAKYPNPGALLRQLQRSRHQVESPHRLTGNQSRFAKRSRQTAGKPNRMPIGRPSSGYSRRAELKSAPPKARHQDERVLRQIARSSHWAAIAVPAFESTP